MAGAISAWDRVGAYAAARKHAAVAEFIRRRPRSGSPLDGRAQMPEDWDESITAEVAGVLAESRRAADAMLGLAHDLEVKLPGTKAAFRDGTLRQSKVAIIARATAVLDPAEARAAEQKVLDRAGRLTPGALRAAIAIQHRTDPVPRLAGEIRKLNTFKSPADAPGPTSWVPAVP